MGKLVRRTIEGDSTVLEWAADAGTPHVAVIAGQVTDDAREEMAVHANAQLLGGSCRGWQ